MSLIAQGAQSPCRRSDAGIRADFKQAFPIVKPPCFAGGKPLHSAVPAFLQKIGHSLYPIGIGMHISVQLQHIANRFIAKMYGAAVIIQQGLGEIYAEVFFQIGGHTVFLIRLKALQQKALGIFLGTFLRKSAFGKRAAVGKGRQKIKGKRNDILIAVHLPGLHQAGPVIVPCKVNAVSIHPRRAI